MSERIEELVPLQKQIGYTFRNSQLLDKALTHKSYVNESTFPLKDNERLEFLGDSVLDLIISEFMVRTYPDFLEGTLSKIRASVVNESCLAQMARDIELGQYLRLGKGEESSGGREKSSLLANAYEAMAGAVFLDSNLKTAQEIFLPVLKSQIENYFETSGFQDFKSDLQEYTQTRFGCTPQYTIVGETGPDHAKSFEVTVKVQDEIRGAGKGKSKKEAEQAAARAALESFNQDTENQANGS
ncbi:MAG: ribonuclease III [Nitrospinaceae bacterium]|nr:ribonuclease III [Nitrospinaceae bacterium]NIR54349.1 ribonuclease III [Nitrospinaceae bacterium]NIS84767.1 ribonuclease III [Nitrospinaceae bacterium]NIT81568.1 ribonuclease III [Nitrospinaceae bacterium]NIU43852.1 ribonuclease III [Nitrospinaceae bacterium]